MSMAFLSSFAWQQNAQAVKIQQAPDWVITIETEQQKDYLQYNRSHMKDIVKATVTYMKGDAKDTDKPTAYEDLWYSQSKCIGMNRRKSLQPGDKNGPSSGQEINIRVRHKKSPASNFENWASAEAVLRVMLDTKINGNVLNQVLVPADSFDSVVQGFGLQKFYAVPEAGPDQPSSTVGPAIHVSSEPEGRDEDLVYSP